MHKNKRCDLTGIAMCAAVRIILVFIFSGVMVSVAAELPDIHVERTTVPIIMNGSNVVLAVSFVGSAYPKSMTEDALRAAFKGMPQNTQRQYPAFLVLKELEYQQAGKPKALLSDIWQPRYRKEFASWEKESPAKIKQMQGWFSSFKNLRLVEMSRFGPYVRIDDRVTIYLPGRPPRPRPWTQYYVKENGRFYKTQEINRVGLFGILVDLAMKGNQSPPRSMPPDVYNKMQWIAADIDPKQPVDKRNENLLYAWSGTNAVAKGRALAGFPDTNYVLVYHNIKCAGYTLESSTNLESSKKQEQDGKLDKAYRILLDMHRTFQSRVKADIEKLWVPQEQDNDYGRMNLLSGNVKIDATAQCDQGIIIILEKGPHYRQVVYLVKNKQGEWKLSYNLENSQYDRLFRNQQFLDVLIKQLKEQAQQPENNEGG